MSADATAWQADVAAAIRSATGAPPGAPRWSPRGGSSLNATWRLDLAGKRFFVKTNMATRSAMFEAEAAGLADLAAADAIRVPQPFASGVAGGVSFLALEWLDIVAGGRDAAMGRALAALHRHTAATHGWHRDNTIGTTPQDNTRTADWAQFFANRRIAPQLALAARNGHAELRRNGDALLAATAVLLAGHAPAPSLLHGDLWSGNAGRLPDGTPVVFDPAVHYGDRETDLAMCMLFGGFGADFYAAYRETWPLPAGDEARRQLYSLYHVLNHANLFGGGYVAQAAGLIRRVLDVAGG